MQVVETIAQTRRAVAAARGEGRRIGFVPTMGALHAGHGRLMEVARADCDYVVVSIFVNPLQFAPGEDYARYPRRLPADLAFCRERGVDLVFAPPVSEMYPQPGATWVHVERLTDTLCGPLRPGHFRGVTTVVSKLFHIVWPDVAYFGQKDAQQCVVIRRMVADLDFPIEIRVVPTVREADGLAMSSRNAYLAAEDRARATVLIRALRAGESLVAAGERGAAAIRARMQAVLATEPAAAADYLTVVAADTLQEVDRVAGKVLLAGAIRLGGTRLIDNIPLEV